MNILFTIAYRFYHRHSGHGKHKERLQPIDDGLNNINFLLAPLWQVLDVDVTSHIVVNIGVTRHNIFSAPNSGLHGPLTPLYDDIT